MSNTRLLAIKFAQTLDKANTPDAQTTLKLQQLITKEVNQIGADYYNNVPELKGTPWSATQDEDSRWGNRTQAMADLLMGHSVNKTNVNSVIQTLVNTTNINPKEAERALAALTSSYAQLYEALKEKTDNFTNTISRDDPSYNSVSKWWDNDDAGLLFRLNNSKQLSRELIISYNKIGRSFRALADKSFGNSMRQIRQ